MKFCFIVWEAAKAWRSSAVFAAFRRADSDCRRLEDTAGMKESEEREEDAAVLKAAASFFRTGQGVKLPVLSEVFENGHRGGGQV